MARSGTRGGAIWFGGVVDLIQLPGSSRTSNSGEARARKDDGGAALAPAMRWRETAVVDAGERRRWPGGVPRWTASAGELGR